MSQPDASSPVVSVIVVSYNTRCLLARCLDSLDASAAPPAIEVLVVDNASADGSAEMVAAEYPEATCSSWRTSASLGEQPAAESARGSTSCSNATPPSTSTVGARAVPRASCRRYRRPDSPILTYH